MIKIEANFYDSCYFYGANVAHTAHQGFVR